MATHANSGSSHSILEAARNNSVLQAQNQILLAYRDQLRQIEDRLNARNTAGFIRSSTAVTRGRSTSMKHSSGSDSRNPTSQNASQKYSNRPLRRKFRVSLPRWFSDCVWEFGILDAGSGWMFQLQPVNYRPHDSFAFQVVRSGNVSAVQRLLDLGQLSVRDHEGTPEYGRDVFTVHFAHYEYFKRTTDNVSS